MYTHTNTQANKADSDYVPLCAVSAEIERAIVPLPLSEHY